MQLALYYKVQDQGDNCAVSFGTTDYRHRNTIEQWHRLAREFLAQYLPLDSCSAVVEAREKTDWYSEFLALEQIAF